MVCFVLPYLFTYSFSVAFLFPFVFMAQLWSTLGVGPSLAAAKASSAMVVFFVEGERPHRAAV
jgi:hypothetical protein